MLPDTTAASADKIRCDACPVMCYIKPGAAGACDRYANHNGCLVRALGGRSDIDYSPYEVWKYPNSTRPPGIFSRTQGWF